MKRIAIVLTLLIFSILFGMAQNIQEQREIELRYQTAIESAQKNFNQRQYKQAKLDYITAREIKPENAAFINEIIAEIDLLIPFGTNTPQSNNQSKQEIQNVKTEHYAGTLVPGATLTAKLAWLQRSAESHNTYIIVVNANENIAPQTLEYKGAINITVVLRGDDVNRTIRLSTNGMMFTVNSNVTFILDKNITLQGHGQNINSIVIVNGGIFKMNDWTTITGNNAGSGGGVDVQRGTFEMNGGTISNNTATQHGGGVFMYGGTFTMSGGTISGNTANGSGGGVYGEFIMNAGTISNNTAKGNGGGVCGTLTIINGIISGNKAVEGGGVAGTLTMRGGTITNNTATEYGGGVCGTLKTKTGGYITGYMSDSKNGNVVNDGSGVLARRGHAIYDNCKSYGGRIMIHSYGCTTKRKETTAGAGAVTWDE